MINNCIVTNIVEDQVVMKKSEAESHLLKLEKFNQKNKEIVDNINQITDKNKQIEQTTQQIESEMQTLKQELE